MPVQSRKLTYLLLAAFALVPFLHLSYLYRPFTEIKWVALYGLASAVLLAGLLRKKPIRLPGLGSAFWIAVVLIIINQALVSAFNSVPIPNDYYIDRISFLVFFVAAFNLQSTQPDFLRNLGRAAILSSAVFACGFFFVLLTDRDATLRDLAGSMGDINMAAQLMIFALPFLLFEWMEGRSNRARAALAALALLLVAAILGTTCRSAWLGTALITGYFFLFLKTPSPTERARSARRWLPTALLASFVVLLSLSFATVPRVRSELRRKIFAAKMDGRDMIWRGTLHLVRQHPFGVGTDQFELAGVQYQDTAGGLVEHRFWASPHDEGLRILSEEGWIGLALFILCAAILLRFLFRRTRGDPKKRALLIALLLVAAPEFVFQFPLQMANTFLLLALTLGALAASGEVSAVEGRPHVSRVFQLCALIFILCLGTVSSVSLFVGSGYRDDLDKIHLACAIYPTNWHACLQEVILDARAGYFERAHAIVDRNLLKYPYYYPYLKAASVLASFEGNTEQSCSYLRRYDQIFDGHSSLHGMLEKYCH